MKLNAGIVTEKLAESKAFYTNVLGFGVSFENDFYVLLHTPNHAAEFSLLAAEHPSQQPLFRPAYGGQGAYLTLEVLDVDDVYARISRQNVPIAFAVRSEPWGDRHFAITDPNGLGIDIVTYAPPAEP